MVEGQVKSIRKGREGKVKVKVKKVKVKVK